MVSLNIPAADIRKLKIKANLQYSFRMSVQEKSHFYLG